MKPIDLPLSPKKNIRLNRLLHQEDKGMKYDEFMMLKTTSDLAIEKGLVSESLNLARLTHSEIDLVYQEYGDRGLFQLMMLAMTTNEFDFKHFTDILKGKPLFDLLEETKQFEDLVPDNDSLPQSDLLSQFNHHVLQPSLSRKLYRSGIHHGSFVYGFGGARILISHPFRGLTGDIYKMYENTLDVVTSLMMRGYNGMFHFLDYLGGLNQEDDDIPKWAIWFSIIASHSDLVIFIKQHSGEFGPSQQLEIKLTPDRVMKKIVEIPAEELQWAKDPEVDEGIDKIYFTEEGMVTEEKWNEMEASHSDPLLKNYVSSGFPKDRLIVLGDSKLEEFPSDYYCYN